MSGTKSVEEALADTRAARARLIGTLEEIQARVAPSRLFDETLNNVRDRSAELVQSAGEVAKARPGAVAGAATAGILLLARKPLWRIGRCLLGRKEETPRRDLSLAKNASHAKG